MNDLRRARGLDASIVVVTLTLLFLAFLGAVLVPGANQEHRLLFVMLTSACVSAPLALGQLFRSRFHRALVTDDKLRALDTLAERIRDSCGPVAGRAAHELVDVGCDVVRGREAMGDSGGALPGADAHVDGLREDLDAQLDDLGRQLHDLLHTSTKRRLEKRLHEVGEPAQWIETRERLERVREAALQR